MLRRRAGRGSGPRGAGGQPRSTRPSSAWRSIAAVARDLAARAAAKPAARSRRRRQATRTSSVICGAAAGPPVFGDVAPRRSLPRRRPLWQPHRPRCARCHPPSTSTASSAAPRSVIGFVFVIIARALNPIDAVVGLFIVGAGARRRSCTTAVFRRGGAPRRRAIPPPAPTAEREDPAAFARRLRWPLAAAGRRVPRLHGRRRRRPACSAGSRSASGSRCSSRPAGSSAGRTRTRSACCASPGRAAGRPTAASPGLLRRRRDVRPARPATRSAP